MDLLPSAIRGGFKFKAGMVRFKCIKIWCEHHTTFLILLEDAYLGVPLL
jgi:hypothetical protein